MINSFAKYLRNDSEIIIMILIIIIIIIYLIEYKAYR